MPLIARKPQLLLHRQVRADFARIATSIIDGSIDFMSGQWADGVKAFCHGVTDGLGLKDDVSHEAWRLIYTSLLMAVHTLTLKHVSSINRTPEKLDSLPEEIDLALSQQDLPITPSFFSETWRLPVVLQMQPIYAEWLKGYVTTENTALSIAAQLPYQFTYCLWDELIRNRGNYRGLDNITKGVFEYPPDQDRLLKEYIQYLDDSYKYLDFKGLPGLIEAIELASGLALRDIYVSIYARQHSPSGETWERQDLSNPESRRGTHRSPSRTQERAGSDLSISLDNLPPAYPAMVLLGDPGAGKSTLLKYHTLKFAGDPISPLPVLLPLSQYAEALKTKPHSLREYLGSYYASRRSSLKEVHSLIDNAICYGRAIILLDGLDEVQADREAVVRRIDDFVREILPSTTDSIGKRRIMPGNRVIVTSRFVGYRDCPLTDRRWEIFSITDWDHNAISRFIRKWTYAVELAVRSGELSPLVEESAKKERSELTAAIMQDSHLMRLASNPLLLTILALIKRQGITLPHRRVELYEIYLKTLLNSWRNARNLDNVRIGPEVDYSELTQILCPLALHFLDTSASAGTIHREELLSFLTNWYVEQDEMPRHAARNAAIGFLGAVHRYSSLLVERGADQFGFLHLTFEEYLAGKGLTLLPEDLAVSKILEHAADDGWHEVILLGVGAFGIVRQSPSMAGQLLERVLRDESTPKLAYAKILLCGEILRDIGARGMGKRAARAIEEQLTRLVSDPCRAPQERLKAGVLLSEVGWTLEDIDWFCFVPSGFFAFGEESAPIDLNYEYWIGKYPVTNLQYGRFINAGGYENKVYWSDEGWRRKRETKWDKPWLWDEKAQKRGLLPVVGVSRYEAEAYVNWLNENIKLGVFVCEGHKRHIPPSYIARLPDEKEWERAARGTDGRTYPWGNQFSGANAHLTVCVEEEEKWGGLAAVCTYREGMSPVGAWDCVGNAAEYALSARGGGGVYCSGSSFRCGVVDKNILLRRESAYPDDRYRDVGFRVVLAPELRS